MLLRVCREMDGAESEQFAHTPYRKNGSQDKGRRVKETALRKRRGESDTSEDRKEKGVSARILVGRWLVLCQSTCESNRIVSEFHFEKMRYCDVRRSSFLCGLSAKERGQGEGADRLMYILSDRFCLDARLEFYCLCDWWSGSFVSCAV